MEHQRSIIHPSRRPPLKFPNGARVAVWIVPNVEHFHYDKPAIALTPMTTALKPDVLNYAWRDYGARVGIWRLMEILERNGFRATAALNSEVVQHYPQIVEEGTRLGWEWMAYGANNSSLFTGMPPDVEHGIIAGVLRNIEDKTGKRPRGWLGPALTETDNTLDIPAEAGASMSRTGATTSCRTRCVPSTRAIVAMPYTLEIGDIPIFLTHGGTAARTSTASRSTSSRRCTRGRA